MKPTVVWVSPQYIVFTLKTMVTSVGVSKYPLLLMLSCGGVPFVLLVG